MKKTMDIDLFNQPKIKKERKRERERDREGNTRLLGYVNDLLIIVSLVIDLLPESVIALI